MTQHHPISWQGTVALPRLMRHRYFRRWMSTDLLITAWNRVGCSLDLGCFVAPQVSINRADGATVAIGRGSALVGRTTLSAWASIYIGQNVMVNDYVHLLTGSHNINDPAFGGVMKPIMIGDNAWIAQGAVLLPGVSIGEGAVVGAYAVVRSEVPPRTVVVGNPAQVLRERPHFEPTFIPANYKRDERSSSVLGRFL